MANNKTKSGKKKLKKITTVDGLAVLMQREFLRINERFDHADKRTDVLELALADFREDTKTGFEVLIGRVDHLDNRVEKIENRVEKIDNRIGKMEERVTQMERSLAEVLAIMREDRRQTVNAMKEFDARLRRVEQKLGLA